MTILIKLNYLYLHNKVKKYNNFWNQILTSCSTKPFQKLITTQKLKFRVQDIYDL